MGKRVQYAKCALMTRILTVFPFEMKQGSKTWEIVFEMVISLDDLVDHTIGLQRF